MKKSQKLLGIIFLFASLLMASCGNSPKSDAKEVGNLVEKIYILEQEYEDGEITKQEYRKEANDIEDQARELQMKLEDAYTKEEKKEFQKELRKLENEIHNEYGGK